MLEGLDAVINCVLAGFGLFARLGATGARVSSVLPHMITGWKSQTITDTSYGHHAYQSIMPGSRELIYTFNRLESCLVGLLFDDSTLELPIHSR